MADKTLAQKTTDNVKTTPLDDDKIAGTDISAATAADREWGITWSNAWDNYFALKAAGATAIKAPCLNATTANVTLSGEQTIDGVLTSTSRILVKNQTAGAENGIYVTAAGAWARAADFDVASEVVDGTMVAVEQGTAAADTLWKLTTNNPITVDTTSLSFSEVAAGSGIANVVDDTTPQLGGDLDANAFDIQFDDATGIRDDSDNEQLIFQKTTTAVNHFEMTNAATGNDPLLAAVGGDANMDLGLAAKGTGNVNVTVGGVNIPASEAFSVAGTAILSDSAGTMTLSNVDALDATTEATIEAAIDTLANLTSVQGNTLTLANNFITSGNFSLTLTQTAATNVTLPTTGTLATITGVNAAKESFVIAVSDETTALTTGTGKVTFRMPYAFTLTEVRSSVTTAPTGSVLTVDINETATTILSTKLTIDATEKTSETAATAAVISDASLADDAEITIDIDAVGSTVAGAGLKVALIGHKT